MNDPLTIYHIEGRRSLRVIWLCEELGLPYRLLYRRGDVMGSMMDIRKAHPLMPFAPLVKFDDEFIVESGAILDVILARFGGGRLVPPVDSSDYPLHAQWMHFAEGTAMTRIALTQATAEAKGVTPDLVPRGFHRGVDIATPVAAGPTAVFEYVDDFLGRHTYFGGTQFTAADIMMYWSLRFAKLWAWIDCEDYPHVAAWRRAVEARPAFVRATQAATPDGTNDYGLPANAPLPPTWPEPPTRAR